MDPSFLNPLAHFLQQQLVIQAAAAQAKQEPDEAARQALLLVNRQKMLAWARAESNALIHEAATFPVRTFVKLDVIMFNLDRLGAVPDSYAEQKEKEDIALLWAKLVNLAEKSKSQMSEAQMAECQRCLEALWLNQLISDLAVRLPAYETWQQLRPQWELARRKRRQVTDWQKLLWIGIAGLALITVLIYASFAPPGDSLVILILGLLGIVATGAIVHERFESLLPGDRQELAQKARQAYQAANLDDVEFWQAVEAQFGATLQRAQMEQVQAEQEAIIAAVFGEPAVR